MGVQCICCVSRKNKLTVAVALDSNHLDGRSSVKRTCRLDIKQPFDRIQFAATTIEIFLCLPGRFGRGDTVANHLRVFEDDRVNGSELGHAYEL
jgi:hypothetical protein